MRDAVSGLKFAMKFKHLSSLILALTLDIL